MIGLPSANGGPADAGYVEAVRETSQALVRLDTVHGGDDVFPLALRVFRAAHRRLGTGSYLPKVERDLIAATGEAGEVAAWLAYDADRQGASRRIIHEALTLSRQAGDRDMELMELGHLAMQAIHLHRPADGLRIAREVLDDGNLPPRVFALFEIRRGRALAQLGDGPGAFGALGRARSVLADGIGARDPYWTWWLTDGEVTSHEAMSHADMGDWKASVEPFHDSADQRVAYRRARYNDLAHLLDALVHVRDWSAAEPVLTEVAGMVGEVASGRTTHLLGRVADRVVRSGAPSAVADAAEDLRAFLHDADRAEERATC